MPKSKMAEIQDGRNSRWPNPRWLKIKMDESKMAESEMTESKLAFFGPKILSDPQFLMDPTFFWTQNFLKFSFQIHKIISDTSF